MKQTLIRLIAGMAVVIATTSWAGANQINGRVVAVADGDTLTVLDDERTRHRLRLDAIDAPERTQPFGQRARQSLAGLAHGRAATAHCPKTDRYGRAVCRIEIDGVDVGLEQVRRGFAWHYLRYAHEQPAMVRAEYARAEEAARGERAGLWSAAAPTPPWDYRRAQRLVTTTQ